MAYGQKETLYDVLELPRDAKATDVVRAYRRILSAMEEEHTPPDARRVALLHQAHEILADEEKRAAYDDSLKRDAFFMTPLRERPRAAKWAGAFVLALAVAVGFVFIRPRAPAPVGPSGKTAQELVTDISFAMARVSILDVSGHEKDAGIAVAVAQDTMAMPCHTLPPGAQLVINNGARKASAVVSLADERLDICKLTVPGAGSRPLVAAQAPRAGEKVFALAYNAAGQAAPPVEGTVKRFIQAADGALVEITMPRSVPRVNGMPVVDAQGKLVGIATVPHSFANADFVLLPAAWIEKARGRTKR